MELLALTCQHCSAPLKVPSGAKFVTCTHCGVQLAVRRTDSVAYTETLEAIDARTERMAEQLDELHRRAALADLDRAWEAELDKYYVAGKDGHRYLPTRGGSVVMGIAIAVVGMVWTAVACGVAGEFHDGPGPFDLITALFPFIGLLIGGIGLWQAVVGYNNAEVYERAEAEYRRRREELLRAAGVDATER